MEDLIVQGDQIKDTLEELQDAVHLTKVTPSFTLSLLVLERVITLFSVVFINLSLDVLRMGNLSNHTRI